MKEKLIEQRKILNTINHYFLMKYDNIENDVLEIKKYNITLGQQIQRLKEYEEYKILKPYLVKKTYLPLLDLKLLKKISLDIDALKRFSFYDGEVNDKAHFKDVTRCLKQERFKNNFFYDDVFIFCNKTRIEYYDGIKLSLIKNQEKMNLLITNFVEDNVEKYESGIYTINDIEENANFLKNYAIKKDVIWYSLLWKAKDHQELNNIKLKISDFEIEKAFSFMPKMNDNLNIVFLDTITKEDKIKLLDSTIINNKLLSILKIEEIIKLKDIKKIVHNCFIRSLKQNKVNIRSLEGEVVNIDLKDELSFLIHTNELDFDKIKIKSNQKQTKTIKNFIKTFNNELSLLENFKAKKESKNKLSTIKC